MRAKYRKHSIRCPEYLAFLRHESGAAQRDIAFHFSYEDWCQWWKDNLGPDWFQKRGKTLGKYCMARNGDKGPYHPDNVRCITHSENSREQPRSKKLTETQVTEIYLSDKTKNALAAEYNVSIYAIKDIRKKKAWRNVTDQLTYTGIRGSIGKKSAASYRDIKAIR